MRKTDTYRNEDCCCKSNNTTEYKPSRRIFKILFLTVLSTLALSLLYTPYYIAGRSKDVLWIPITAVLIYLYKTVFSGKPREYKKTFIILSILFSCFTATGKILHRDLGLGRYFYNVLGIIQYIVIIIGLSIMFYAFLTRITELLKQLPTDKNSGNRRIFWFDSHSFVSIFIAILISMIPYYITFFPGIMTSDACYQARQTLGLTEFNSHHPVIHTAFISIFFNIGKFFGNLNLAAALYSFTQMIIMAAIFAFSMCYQAQLGIDRRIRMVLFSLYAFFPVNALYAITMWKDVIFGGLLLLLFIFIFEMIRNPDKILKSKLNITVLITLLFLFCLFRNNGLYAFLLFVPAFLFAFRRHFIKIVTILLIASTGVYAFNFVVFTALQTPKGSVREALSVPLQQIARTVKEHGSEISENDKAVINRYMPYDELPELYNAQLSDPVKGSLDDKAFSEDPGALMSVWFGLALKYPLTYIESFLCNSYGYWYPNVDYWIAGYFIGDVNEEVDIRQYGLYMNDAFGFVRYTFIGILEGLIIGIPPFSLLCSIGFSVWLILFASALLIIIKKKKFLLALYLPACVWITTLASPVHSEYRYVYGIMLVAPVFCGIVLDMFIKNFSHNNDRKVI